MHRLKYTIFIIFLAVTGLFRCENHLMAQSVDVHLEEVQIRGSAKNAYTSDLHTVRFDTILKTKYFGSDLARILKRETNLNITQYGGEGSLASIRLRGSAPSQTQINWNGIPVNSPTTGSIDLSLLSGGMADAIDIAYGAGGSLFGNGTFGGSINLFNKPDWDNRLSVNLATEAGSWKHFKSGAGLSLGNNNWQYHFTGMYQSSPNTYRFANTFKSGNPMEHRLNDSMNLMAVQQHIFLRLPKNWFVQYGAWIHDRSKQLPSSMSSTPVYSSWQEDRSIRQFIRVSKWFRKSTLEMTAACFTDSLLYGEKVASTDSIIKLSGIRSSDTNFSLFHRWFISDNVSIESGADMEFQSARVEAYEGPAGETRAALFSMLKYQINPFSASISYRQVFYSMTGPKPLFAAAFQYHLLGKSLSVKGQISNKFRFPTLNDRYWKPGGNPDLLPETGVGYDLGLDWSTTGSVKSNITLSALAFIQHINNWIQWVPSGTYWSPQNIKQVRCQGLEMNLTAHWTLGPADISAKTMYTYTESLDLSLASVESRFSRQLAYVPFHMLKVQAGATIQRFEATIGYRYTGRRFTSDDHDQWLDLKPCHLADLSAGYTFQTRKSALMLTATVSNLFNASYQLIRAYPAPGRSFYLSVNYLFNQKNQKK